MCFLCSLLCSSFPWIPCSRPTTPINNHIEINRTIATPSIWNQNTSYNTYRLSWYSPPSHHLLTYSYSPSIPSREKGGECSTISPWSCRVSLDGTSTGRPLIQPRACKLNPQLTLLSHCMIRPIALASFSLPTMGSHFLRSSSVLKTM